MALSPLRSVCGSSRGLAIFSLATQPPLGLALRHVARPMPSCNLRSSIGSPCLRLRTFASSCDRRAQETKPSLPQQTPPQQQQQPRLTASEIRRLQEEAQKRYYSQRNRSLAYYSIATIIFALGITYAAVPLYRAFCSATGFGGAPQIVGIGRFEPSRLIPMDPGANKIRVSFNADASDELPWSFKPSQEDIYVIPGETALAFFTAKNKSKRDIIGIATYNVAPDRIAAYFSKVECFCFEEQKLLAGEEVDLPVFFFIDNDFLDDPNTRDVKDVVLSYTFFAARRNKVTGQLEPDTDLDAYKVGMDLPGVK